MSHGGAAHLAPWFRSTQSWADHHGRHRLSSCTTASGLRPLLGARPQPPGSRIGRLHHPCYSARRLREPLQAPATIDSRTKITTSESVESHPQGWLFALWPACAHFVPLACPMLFQALRKRLLGSSPRVAVRESVIREPAGPCGPALLGMRPAHSGCGIRTPAMPSRVACPSRSHSRTLGLRR